MSSDVMFLSIPHAVSHKQTTRHAYECVPRSGVWVSTCNPLNTAVTCDTVSVVSSCN